jgi:hypothetical protein
MYEKFLNSMPFRPKTDQEIKSEELEEKKKKHTKKLLQEQRTKLLENKISVELLREWVESCGFDQSIAVNSSLSTAGNTIDPYKVVFYDGINHAIKTFFSLLDNDFLINVLKKDD